MLRLEVRDAEFGLLGLVVVDSAPNGSATGGVRAVETLDGLDLEALARVMTRKYALLPFPRNGGAKAAVVVPRDAPEEERAARLRAFGRHLAGPMRAGRYRPWTDIGTNEDDLAAIYAGAGAPWPGMGGSGPYTAYSLAGAALAVRDHLGLAPARALIHGFGSVGRELAASLARLGFPVVGVANRAGSRIDPRGLDVTDLCARPRGDGWMLEQGGAGAPRDLFAVEAELFFACADAGSLDAGGARELAARAVIPGANEPCGPGAEEELAARGILLLPDFVVNAGGVLGSFLSGFALGRARIERFEHEAWRDLVARLLARAAAEGVGPAELARRAVAPDVERLLQASWLARKGHGAFYRLARAPRPLRRLAGEVALRWARRTLARRLGAA